MEVASKSSDAQNGLSMLSRHETKRYRFGHLPSSRTWQLAIARLYRSLRTSRIVDPALLCLLFVPLALAYLTGPPPEEFWGDLASQSDYAAWMAAHPLSVSGSWFLPSSVPLWVIWPSPAVIIHAILFAATGNPWTAVKVVLLLQLVVGISSAYALAADFHAGRAGRAVATLAYVTAPFFQAQMAHHLFNSWGYALLPAAFLLLLRYLRDRSLGSALLAGLGVAPILVSSPLAVFFLGLPLVVFCLSHSIAGTTGEGHPPRRSKGPRFAVAASMRRAKTVTARILVSFFPVGLGVLFAAFYLWPTAYDPFPYRSTEFGYPRQLWYGGDLVSVFTLQYYETLPFTRDPIPLAFVLVPVATWGLALLGVWTVRRNRNPARLSLIAAGAFAFSLSFANPILPSPFLALRDFVPGFGYLRTPDRFLPTAILALSILAGSGASAVIRGFQHITAREDLSDAPAGAPSQPRGDWRRLVSTSVVLVLLVLPFGSVFYEQNTAYFLGAFRTTVYGPTVHSYQVVQQWLRQHERANTRILDLTDVGENRLQTLDLPAVVYPGRSFVHQFAYSAQFPNLLCRLGIGFVVSPSSNFSGTEERQTYLLLQGSGLYEETPLGVSEASALDILEHRLPPRIQDVSVFESRVPCDGTYAGRVLLTMGGPRATLVANGLFPNHVPALLSTGPNSQLLDQLAPVTDALVVDDPSLVDLGMRLFGTYIPLVEYAEPPWQRVVFQGGFEQPFGELAYQSIDGYLVLSDNAITASDPEASVTVPFRVEMAGEVAIAIRVLGADQGEIFNVRVDSGPNKTINTGAWRGFQWVDLGNETLEAGTHTLTLTKTSERTLILDSIAVMPRETWTNFSSTTAANVNATGLPLALAVNPASLWAGARGGPRLPISESLNELDWNLRGNQSMEIHPAPGAPTSPVVQWQYTSGPFQFVDLILSHRSVTPDWSLDFWLLGKGAPHTLTFWLVLENGSYIDADVGMNFEGWQEFRIPLSTFRGIGSGPLNFTELRMIPSPGNGSTSIGGLAWIMPASVVSNLDSPSGQVLRLPTNSSVAFSYVAPNSGGESIEFRVDDPSNPDVRVCVDALVCQSFTDLRNGVGRFWVNRTKGEHVLSIENVGNETQRIEYVWIAEKPLDDRTPVATSSVLSEGDGFRVSVNATAPVALVLGESFDSGWIAMDGRTRFEPFFAGLWSVGFVVGEPGLYSISITYASSSAQIGGKIVSTGMVALAAAWFVVSWSRSRRRLRKSRDYP